MTALVESHQERGENTLRLGPGPRSISAPHLAVDDRRANRLLSTPIGGVDRRIDQEPEPVKRMSQNMLGQAAIGRVAEPTRDQLFQSPGKPQAGACQIVTADAMAAPLPTQLECLVDERQDSPRQEHGALDGRLQQFPTAPLQVSNALLMKGL